MACACPARHAGWAAPGSGRRPVLRPVRPAPASLTINDDAVLRRMDSVLEENARLREEFWKARKTSGKEGARQAEEALSASDERVEDPGRGPGPWLA